MVYDDRYQKREKLHIDWFFKRWFIDKPISLKKCVKIRLSGDPYTIDFLIFGIASK